MKKVVYITSSRADYGIVREYLKLLNNNKDIDFSLLVTGSILNKQDGFNLIEEDNFKISKMVKYTLSEDNTREIIKAMSKELKEFGEYFYHNKVDLLIVLGDRYEVLPPVIAASMERVRILHFHGGELTYGNYDEFIRHSITKMSHYHFTSCEEYKNRVIRLGENPKYVYNVGALGCENCLNIDEEQVDSSVKSLEKNKYFVFLYHSETLTNNNDFEVTNEFIKIIKKYNKYKFVVIGNNWDTNSHSIKNKLLKSIKEFDNVYYFNNLNPDSYHYLLKRSICLIGNSSSGIIEAPILSTYVINIGKRQDGRCRCSNVIDIDSGKELDSTIKKVLKLPKRKFISPYYKKDSIKNAYKYTLKILEEDYFIKEFYDGEINE